MSLVQNVNVQLLPPQPYHQVCLDDGRPPQADGPQFALYPDLPNLVEDDARSESDDEGSQHENANLEDQFEHLSPNQKLWMLLNSDTETELPDAAELLDALDDYLVTFKVSYNDEVTEFKALKPQLILASPYFSSMLRHHPGGAMTESETHPEVFQAIMAYIHLGEVKTFPENWLTSSLAGEMLAFCHRALIMDLK